MCICVCMYVCVRVSVRTCATTAADLILMLSSSVHMCSSVLKRKLFNL